MSGQNVVFKMRKDDTLASVLKEKTKEGNEDVRQNTKKKAHTT